MPMIDRETLHRLVAEADPALTILLRTDPEQRDLRSHEARLRNLIAEAERLLEARGVDARRRETLLERAGEATRKFDFAEHRDPSLAMFLSEQGQEVLPLPGEVADCVVAGRFFHLKPLLSAIAWNRRFYLLALSGRDVRLLSATPFASHEVPLDTLPPEVQAEVDSRPAAEGANEEFRKTVLLEDLHRVASAVRVALGSDDAPVVLAAEPQVAGNFVKLGQLRNLYEEALVLNPFAFKESELRAKAVAVLRPLLDAESEAVLDLANARLGTAEPTVSLRLEEVLQAAHDGRVDAIIVDRDAAIWGRFDPEGGALVAHGSQSGGDEDLLNVAAVMTLRQGGRAFAMEKSRVPRQSPVVATMRF
jgi:hypothetical protein